MKLPVALVLSTRLTSVLVLVMVMVALGTTELVGSVTVPRTVAVWANAAAPAKANKANTDRKSTRLNSSHRCISYAVFCLKKKKKERNEMRSLELQINEASLLAEVQVS